MKVQIHQKIGHEYADEHWYILPLNAEQWAIGPLSIGRRNGKMFPMVGQNAQLKFYQEAIKEQLEDEEMLPEGQYTLTFFVWRELVEYEGAKKKVKKNLVDATNIQKGTEDALQGILFGNDRDVRDIRTVIVEQATAVDVPLIVIRASLWQGFFHSEIPPSVQSAMDTLRVEQSFGPIDDDDDDEDDGYGDIF